MYSVGMINYNRKVAEHNLFRCKANVEHQTGTNLYIIKEIEKTALPEKDWIFCTGFKDMLNSLLSLQVIKKKYYNITLKIN